MQNLLKLEDVKNLVVGYVETLESKNSGFFGFRTVTINKTLVDSIKKDGLIYPLIFANEDAKKFIIDNNINVFVLPNVEDYKDGQTVEDGQQIDVSLCDFIVLGGRNRLLSLLALGNKTQTIKYIFDNINTINKSNIQHEQKNSSVLSKILGRINEEDFNLKKVVLESGVNWSSKTLTNNITSISDLLAILKNCNIEDKLFLESLIYVDAISFNTIRQFYNFIPTNYKITNNLTKTVKDENNKTVKDENNKAVKNANFEFLFASFLSNYLKYTFAKFNNYKISKTKVEDYCKTLEDNEDAKNYKVGNFDKKFLESLTQFIEEDDANLIALLPSFIRTLPKNNDNDVFVSNLFNDKTQTYKAKNVINLDNETLNKLKTFEANKNATKVKALKNKLFTITKSEDTTTTQLTQMFISVLSSLNEDEKQLIKELL